MENIANIIAAATHFTFALSNVAAGPVSVVLSGPEGAVRVDRFTGATTVATAADAIWDGAGRRGQLKKARGLAARWMTGDTRP